MKIKIINFLGSLKIFLKQALSFGVVFRLKLDLVSIVVLLRILRWNEGFLRDLVLLESLEIVLRSLL